MPNADIRTVGILGAGRVGTAVARQAIKAGYGVLIGTSRPARDIEMIVDIVVPGAKAADAEAVVRGSDIVILAVPLPKYRSLVPAHFAGKIVIDAMNYWAPTDGHIDVFTEGVSSSEIIQQFLPDARLVKSLNHIGYHELEADDLPLGHPQRRALALAGDDETARRVVSGFIDRLGYDPVDAGELVAGKAFATGTEIFNGRHQRAALEQLLGVTARAEELA